MNVNRSWSTASMPLEPLAKPAPKPEPPKVRKPAHDQTDALLHDLITAAEESATSSQFKERLACLHDEVNGQRAKSGNRQTGTPE